MKLGIIIAIFVALLLPNCYSTSKHYVAGSPYYGFGEQPVSFKKGESQFESGEPYWLLDKLGHWIFSLPAKILLWNWSFSNHDISEKQKRYLKEYMRVNNLTGVKVRFNQYAPFDELMRLIRNRRISGGWRYTVGIYNWLLYTLLPERLFAGLIGGDHYNPFSNTINVYSGSIAILLHEGGHAKDMELRVHRGAYLATRLIPVFGPLYQEAVASDDAVVYLRGRCEKELELQAYQELSPAYSTYLFGEFLPGPASLLAAVPGHFYGVFKSSKERDRKLVNCRRPAKQSKLKPAPRTGAPMRTLPAPTKPQDSPKPRLPPDHTTTSPG